MGTWVSLKPVDSAGEENCLAIAVRLDWELSRLDLETLGGGVEALLGDGGAKTG
jgi:hypothetical protein